MDIIIATFKSSSSYDFIDFVKWFLKNVYRREVYNHIAEKYSYAVLNLINANLLHAMKKKDIPKPPELYWFLNYFPKYIVD